MRYPSPSIIFFQVWGYLHFAPGRPLLLPIEPSFPLMSCLHADRRRDPGMSHLELGLRSQLNLMLPEQADQLNKIYSMFGVATESNWPGVSELPKYQELMPEKEIKGAFKDVFRNYDPYAVMLLERMLTLDPSKRISAEDAVEHDFFRIDPLPSKPTSLKNESSLQLMVLKRSKRKRAYNTPHVTSS